MTHFGGEWWLHTTNKVKGIREIIIWEENWINLILKGGVALPSGVYENGSLSGGLRGQRQRGLMVHAGSDLLFLSIYIRTRTLLSPEYFFKQSNLRSNEKQTTYKLKWRWRWCPVVEAPREGFHHLQVEDLEEFLESKGLSFTLLEDVLLCFFVGMIRWCYWRYHQQKHNRFFFLIIVSIQLFWSVNRG